MIPWHDDDDDDDMLTLAHFPERQPVVFYAGAGRKISM